MIIFDFLCIELHLEVVALHPVAAGELKAAFFETVMDLTF